MSNNRINKVAIVGATGHVASHVVKHLLATGKHSITALTRQESTATFPPGVNVARVDYTSNESLITALKGHDFLMITLPGSHKDASLHTKIVQAASIAGVPWIMPNIYACDPFNNTLNDTWVFGNHVKTSLADVQAAHKETGTNHVILACGFWYEWSLSHGENSYGFDVANKKAVICDEGAARANTSTFALCGKAVAALLSLPVKREGGITGPVIEDWKNNAVFVASYRVSQRDMLESLHRVLGTTDAEWSIEYQSSEERVRSGYERLAKGDFVGFMMALYSRIWYPTEDGDYETSKGLDNGKLGLDKEDIDVSTKWVVEQLASVGDSRKITFSA
ncbi:NAD(P)-binding protein [Massarina eburnea CBS 473.64]|uniref:NAD(P)-binding protein n=1 Tax=Massarina eburnea CBS 473.64 TaxID=1395130 RepID=A0A6A6RU62_9PLEO|nr:NAD(P)-binding protein [Massarina eburnea CBS 473.64]